jgi:2-polyprenyl-3-methyl-5-hydroxy-6-metoxy-1,4-benzoquinol methylase
MKKYCCRICDSEEFIVIYDGQVRSGGINSDFIDGHTIRECSKCSFVSIFPILADLENFYETEQYRKEFFEDISVSDLQRTYDIEQNDRIKQIGIENIRGRVIGDFGAGPGLFLDAVQGVAKKTVAIEPTKLYHKYFDTKGHHYYNYAQELITSNVKLDLAVSFDTIEHVENIKEFVKGIHETLISDGVLYLSMPNHNDISRLLLPDELSSFLYMKAHLNYFTETTAKLLLERQGFLVKHTGYIHKYNLSNLLQWAKFGKPGKFDTSAVLDEYFQNNYINEVNRLGLSSHLFLIAQKIN